MATSRLAEREPPIPQVGQGMKSALTKWAPLMDGRGPGRLDARVDGGGEEGGGGCPARGI